jgi:hypothetical protein
VLVAKHHTSSTSKLQVKWKDTHCVVSVESDYVFVVENLLAMALKAARATRLQLYQDKEVNVTSELAQAAKHNDNCTSCRIYSTRATMN